MFIYLLREKENVWIGEGQRETGRGRILSPHYTGSAEPNLGLELTNRTMNSWPKVKSRARCFTDEPPRCPKISWEFYFILFFVKFVCLFRMQELGRGRGRKPSRLSTVSTGSRAQCEAQTHKPQMVRSWSEPKSEVQHLTDWATQATHENFKWNNSCG